MKRLLVLLIGGRQLPTFFALRYVRPDVLLPVHTPESRKTLDELQDTWRKLVPMAVWLPAREVDGDDSEAIRQLIVELAFTYAADHEITVHVTGAPTPLSIGAALACKEVEHFELLFIDTRRGEILEPVRNRRGASGVFRVKARTYLESYGARNIQVQPTPSPTRVAYAKWVARHYDRHARAVLGYQPNDEALARYLDALGAREAPSWRGALDRNDPIGGWLAAYTWNALTAFQRGADGCDGPLFDDALFDPRYTAEEAVRNIDFLGVRRGVAVAIECKTGSKAMDHGCVTQLVAAVAPIGALYVHRFVVTDRRREEIRGTLHAGDQQRVVVTTLEDLPTLPRIVARELGLVQGETPRFPLL